MPTTDTATLIAFDLETTGLSPRKHAIIEVGAVKFDFAGTVHGQFHQLAAPGAPLPGEVTQLTGITDAMLEGCPPPAAAAQQFVEWAGPDALLLAHNADFDVRFLTATFLNAGVFSPRLAVVDTLRWAKSLQLETPDHKLGSLVAHFGIPSAGAHRSLADAHAVMALTLKFLESAADPKAELVRRIELPKMPKSAPAAWPEY